MTPSKTLLVITLFLLSCALSLLGKEHEQRHTEELFLKHLPDGRVFAQFEFTTIWDVHPLLFAKPAECEDMGHIHYVVHGKGI